MKHLAIPALALLFVGAGCVTPASTTARFSSPELGLAFEYPTAWGEPTIYVERGTKNGINGEECEYQRGVSFTKLGEGSIVLTAMNTEGCKPDGRGGYWGDNAAYLIPDRAYLALCEDGTADICDAFQTSGGVTVIHHRFPSYQLPLESGTLKNVNEYSAYHEGHPLAGVMVSEEFLLLNNKEDQADELRALVDSLSFVK